MANSYIVNRTISRKNNTEAPPLNRTSNISHNIKQLHFCSEIVLKKPWAPWRDQSCFTKFLNKLTPSTYVAPKSVCDSVTKTPQAPGADGGGREANPVVSVFWGQACRAKKLVCNTWREIFVNTGIYINGSYLAAQKTPICILPSLHTSRSISCTCHVTSTDWLHVQFIHYKSIC